MSPENAAVGSADEAAGARAGGRRLTDRLAELASTLSEVDDDISRKDMAGKIVEAAVLDVPGARRAGITLTSPRHQRIELLAYTDPMVGEHDEIQRSEREGPCISAALEDRLIRVDDLLTDSRWPRYQNRAAAALPIRSILSLQLFVDEDDIGALNIFADEAHAFVGDIEEIAIVFATHAALTWRAASQNRRLRSALGNRDLIGQAKGILMERYGIDALAAFELIRRLSQESNVKLLDVAQRIAQRE